MYVYVCVCALTPGHLVSAAAVKTHSLLRSLSKNCLEAFSAMGSLTPPEIGEAGLSDITPISPGRENWFVVSEVQFRLRLKQASCSLSDMTCQLPSLKPATPSQLKLVRVYVKALRCGSVRFCESFLEKKYYR